MIPGVKWGNVRSDLKSIGKFLLSLVFLGLIIFWFAETMGDLNYIPDIIEKVISGVILLFYTWVILSWIKDRYFEWGDSG